MIHLTRLNHRPLVLNADLIESIDVTPDTVISLTTGQKLVVLEAAEEVVRLVVEFRRSIYSCILLSPSSPAAQSECAGAPEDGGGNRVGHGRDNRADSRSGE
jgi:flagellar protein FlbD